MIFNVIASTKCQHAVIWNRLVEWLRLIRRWSCVSWELICTARFSVRGSTWPKSRKIPLQDQELFRLFSSTALRRKHYWIDVCDQYSHFFFLDRSLGSGDRWRLRFEWPDHLLLHQRLREKSVHHWCRWSHIHSGSVGSRKSSEQRHGADCHGPGWGRYFYF